MSLGMIPISSDNGFSKDVIDECGKLITDKTNPEEYKKAIEYFVDNSLLESESKKCMKHIRECHNLKTEIKKVIEFYNTL